MWSTSPIVSMLKRWREIWRPPEPDLRELKERVRLMERNIVLPVKGTMVVLMFYYLFFSNWFERVPAMRESALEVALEVVQRFFLVYVMLNAGFALLLVAIERVSLNLLLWMTVVATLLDSMFVAALALVTGGFNSIVYWVFVALIVRNAVSIPPPTPQILMNVLVTSAYVLAGIAAVSIDDLEAELLDPLNRHGPSEILSDPAAEPIVLRVSLLLLVTACGYGVQVLVDKKRRAEGEAREFAVRQEQLQSTGRLAAEIAHQLKNPLGIMNNALYSLQKAVKEGQGTRQIQIIREEIERSDRILTELMGYARLSEGRVQRVDVCEELDRALTQVFPSGTVEGIRIHRDYAAPLPPLMIQKSHLEEVFVNLFQNAREALAAGGNLWVEARLGDEDYSVLIRIRDDGPGIPPDLVEKVFEPYFTTRVKGTGLGLSIVRHNVELYNGAVTLESELGKGACFVLVFHARMLLNLKM